MRYDVAWDTACYAQLDEIIDAGVSYEDLRQTIRLIEEELSVDAGERGVEISEGLRRLDVTSCRVYFHVDKPNAKAVVDAITLHREK